jgi:hypothetical protein
MSGAETAAASSLASWCQSKGQTSAQRQKAVEGGTVKLRQKQPSLKKASNASARSEAQHSAQAIERREST